MSDNKKNRNTILFYTIFAIIFFILSIIASFDNIFASIVLMTLAIACLLGVQFYKFEYVDENKASRYATFTMFILIIDIISCFIYIILEKL
jgi:hypothetical protein